MSARPSNEIVLETYLAALIPELVGRIDDTLPADRATWSSNGFVTYAVVGGSGEPELRQRRPVFRVECFATNVDSLLVPWGKATALAEAIRDLGERRARGLVLGNQAPTGPAAFSPFVVTNFLVLVEPRRIPDDAASYARVALDVELWWSPLS